MIDTNGMFEVFKIGERTFQIGDLNLDINKNKLFYDFIYLLDKGSKFIPCYYNEDFFMFKDLFLNIDKEVKNFNDQLFIKDSMINRGFDFTNEDYLDEPNDIFKVFSKSINRKKIKFPNCSESIKFKIWNL